MTSQPDPPRPDATGPTPLSVGGRTIADASDRVCRYAGLPWSGGPPEVWAFPYYDAVPTEHDDVVTPTDVLCAAALHPGLSRSDLAFFVERESDVSEWLSAVPTEQELWAADDDLLAHLDALAEFDPDLSLTLLTKVLHRKRPHFLPLLDRHVIDFYRRTGEARRAVEAWPWVVRRIRDDLAAPEQRLLVEIGIPTVGVDPRSKVMITGLRYLDIAIWMEGK